VSYSTNIPNASGWWYWKEAENMQPERLLIVVAGDYAEVATDDAVIEATGISREDAEHLASLGAFNYWEMTDCRRMGGMWAQETHEQWIGKRVHKVSLKPFQGGRKVNTVKAITVNPHDPAKKPSFIFEEDGSIVRCENCVLVENEQTIARLNRMYEHNLA
jgi:hypothetical protein